MLALTQLSTLKQAPVLLSKLEVEMNDFNMGRKFVMRDKMRAR